MGAIRRFWAWLEPLHRKYALSGAIALMLLAGALLGAIFGGKDGEANANTLPRSNTVPQSNPVPNPLSVLASRSPGARPDGALYQSKPRFSAERARARPRIFLPHDRVLSAVRTRRLASAAPPEELAFGLRGIPVEFMPTPSLTRPGFGSAFDVPAFAFGEAPLLSGMPGTPDAPGTTPPDPEPAIPGTPGPAVPEPATWLLMIVGLGIVGQVLRRSGARPTNSMKRAVVGAPPPALT